ncbi:MAG: hypothetical protein JSS35_02050, partial [Proteobacteria bacterium]|nr:hypothetical protein [Pseudomonadota bacterium]
MGLAISRALAALLAVAGLAACSSKASSGMAADGAICQPFPKASSPATGPAAAPGGDPAAAVEDCLHRWGYALAHSDDDAQHVANA